MRRREELVAALQARLDRAAATADAWPVLEPGALDEARQLDMTLCDDDGDLQARYLLGWLYSCRYQALPDDHQTAALNEAITMLISCFIAGAAELISFVQPLTSHHETPTVAVRLQQALQFPDRDLISAAAGLWKRILDDAPAIDSDRARHLSSLGDALRARSQRTGAQADLDAAIGAGRAAVETTPVGHRNRAGHLTKLGRALGDRFERTGAHSDAEDAIAAFEAAANAAPSDHPDQAIYLDGLGRILKDRAQRTGARADLDAAINAHRAALEITPSDHPNRAVYLCSLGNALRARSARVGTQPDLDEAIAALEAAVNTSPADHPHCASYLSNLGAALLDLSERTGAQADLDAAVETCQAAVDTTPADDPNWAGRMNGLGIALRMRCQHTGAPRDLDDAITALESAVDATPASHPDRAIYQSNLAGALTELHERSGVRAHLDAAIAASHGAVDSTPADNPDRPAMLSILGDALLTRFQGTGARADLEAAIKAGRAAVETTPADHPSQAPRLTNLGNALQERSELTGAQADLDAAIEACRAAADFSPADHPDRAMYLTNLGIALQRRFERTGAQPDLDAAIQAKRAAVDAVSARRPSRAIYLNNLGVALRARFKHGGAQPDLDAAIEAGKAAVDATPADHPDRAIYLHNIGRSLLTKSELSGEQADLDAAIEAGKAAVDATPADHPRRAKYLNELGTALRARSGLSGTQADLDAALSAYIQATTLVSARPSTRIRAARAGASLAAESEPSRAADLLEEAVLLLPEIAPRQLDRSDQQHALGGFAELASDAAALTLTRSDASAAERAARALRLLEAGRAVLFSQALDTRDDLSLLSQRHPDHAERFITLRGQLDQPADGPLRTTAGEVAAAGATLGRETEKRRQLAAALDETLAKIRRLNGFASFGLPPTIEELLAQAAPGPVVTVNVSSHRSDALILTPAGIISLALPALTRDALVDQVISFHHALHAAANASRRGDRQAAQRTLASVLGWLWDTIADPVLDALGYHQCPQRDSDWPRVWWSPGGLLGLLPLHAAGHHTERETDSQGRRTVMDRVISSYIPTIRALRYARQHASHPDASARSLIVGMPVTPGLPGGGKLPNVPAEITRIQTVLPDPVILTEPEATVSGPATSSSGIPTRANVLAQLPGCSIAHFACHGTTDLDDPSKSQLLLHDHARTPFTVASLAAVNSEQLQLVYLSACKTAFTLTTELLDEAIHLTSAFLLSGSRHVIGTLWEVNDRIAADIAAAFYSGLRTKAGTIDPDQAAYALHHSVLTVRDTYTTNPSLWAAHLHAGA